MLGIGRRREPDTVALRRPRRPDAGRLRRHVHLGLGLRAPRRRAAHGLGRAQPPVRRRRRAGRLPRRRRRRDRAAPARARRRGGPGLREAARGPAGPGRPDEERLPVDGQPRAAHADHEHPRLLPAAAGQTPRPARDAPPGRRPHRAQRPPADGPHRGHAHDVADRGRHASLPPGAARRARPLAAAVESVTAAACPLATSSWSRRSPRTPSRSPATPTSSSGRSRTCSATP